MPRLNVYLPADVYELATRWRDRANLSDICARAIRDELDAAESYRASLPLLQAFGNATPLERGLASRFDLATAIVGSANGRDDLRDVLGRLAAGYLDRNLSDGAQIAIAGGRQMWCMVRQLTPRLLKTTITALGVRQADPKLLHAHPNTLATLLWLLYSPRSDAHVIGAEPTDARLWSEFHTADRPTYFVIASCSRFDPDSSFSKLVGEGTTETLGQSQVVGDFAYVFLDQAARPVPVNLGNPQFSLPAKTLMSLARRKDARVVLVAGGVEKADLIEKILAARLCNVLVTDEGTATRLSDQNEGSPS